VVADLVCRSWSAENDETATTDIKKSAIVRRPNCIQESIKAPPWVRRSMPFRTRYGSILVLSGYPAKYSCVLANAFRLIPGIVAMRETPLQQLASLPQKALAIDSLNARSARVAVGKGLGYNGARIRRFAGSPAGAPLRDQAWLTPEAPKQFWRLRTPFC
jgi:hypothetical protein